MRYHGSDKNLEQLKSAREKAALKHQCGFCSKAYSLSNLKKHKDSCKFNPKNIRVCPVCGKAVINKPYSKHAITCSRACANTLFRSGEKRKGYKNYNHNNYRRICFASHDKKCIVCGEHRIVEVHHVDGNKKNNNIRNLLPFCPTHHQYYHSRYRYIVQPCIDKYLKKVDDLVKCKEELCKRKIEKSFLNG